MCLWILILLNFWALSRWYWSWKIIMLSWRLLKIISVCVPLFLYYKTARINHGMMELFLALSFQTRFKSRLFWEVESANIGISRMPCSLLLCSSAWANHANKLFQWHLFFHTVPSCNIVTLLFWFLPSTSVTKQSSWHCHAG